MVRQDDEAARQYILARLKVHIAQPFIGLLVEREGESVGAVILNDYRPGRNIELTVAIDGPWTTKDFREIIRYCFERVRRITMRTKCDNARAIKMLEALGFKREGVMREWFEEKDAVVFGLLRSEQKIYARRTNSS
ncbi:GNAT family protein [Bradyrhizobium sp. JR18.2]|uniref:GNAT family N-acetyltransferase n=1 Tax=Bradyrhizobium sp. JR18.2 TaxID=3156369 RepID=UPI003397CAEB